MTLSGFISVDTEFPYDERYVKQSSLYYNQLSSPQNNFLKEIFIFGNKNKTLKSELRLGRDE